MSGLGHFFELRSDCEALRFEDEPIDEDQAHAAAHIYSAAVLDRPYCHTHINPSRLLAKRSPLEIGSSFGSHFECQ